MQLSSLFFTLIIVFTVPAFDSAKNRRAKRFDWQDAGDLYWANNCDWNGGDFSNVPSSGENCGGICVSTGGCSHFTWTTYNGGTCWLKQGAVSLDQAIYDPDTSSCGMLKSGPPPPPGGCTSTQSQNCVQFINNCQQTIWVGILGAPSIPAGGGFQLNQGASSNVMFDANWSGRFWGRTECDSSGACATGDCGHKIQCNGAGGNPPATLAEITFRGSGGIDYYDVSVVDGFNVAMQFAPIPGTIGEQASGYTCTEANCLADLNANCPADFIVRDSQNNVVACKSACLAYGTPQYCCTGEYNSPQKCQATQYADQVKAECPLAYSYAFDDTKSTFTCKGNNAPSPAYMVTFC